MKDKITQKKVAPARLSIFSNCFLIVIKLFAGIFSGSVSIISEAIHSGMDLMAAIIAFFSVRISNNPPDKTHPYGHGKFENVSGVVEALLIFGASVWIIYEAVKKLFENEPIETIGFGFVAMFVSCIVNIFVSRRLYKVAKETDSVALEADALHLKTDVITSAGVGIGLLFIWLTGYTFLDPIVAIAVAIFIMYEAFILLKKAYTPLLDIALPENEILIIRECLDTTITAGMSYHKLRTRKSGNFRYVDVHLEVPEITTVKAAHDLCDIIENEIRVKLNHTEINIHVEPISISGST